jgi:hypothetical protein
MLKLGVQLHLTPALSKACHPHVTKEQFPRLNGVLYIFFPSIEQQLLPRINSRQAKKAAQFSPGSSGEFATS